MAKERQQGSFHPRELTYFLDGAPERTLVSFCGVNVLVVFTALTLSLLSLSHSLTVVLPVDSPLSLPILYHSSRSESSSRLNEIPTSALMKCTTGPRRNGDYTRWRRCDSMTIARLFHPAQFRSFVHHLTSEHLDIFRLRMELVSLVDPGFWTRIGVHVSERVGKVVVIGLVWIVFRNAHGASHTISAFLLGAEGSHGFEWNGRLLRHDRVGVSFTSVTGVYSFLGMAPMLPGWKQPPHSNQLPIPLSSTLHR